MAVSVGNKRVLQYSTTVDIFFSEAFTTHEVMLIALGAVSWRQSHDVLWFTHTHAHEGGGGLSGVLVFVHYIGNDVLW